MKTTALDLAYFALQCQVSGNGPGRYLVPDRSPIVIPRTRYIVPLVADVIRQSEPHGLGVVLWLEDGNNWKISPAFALDDHVLALRLGHTRETRIYDSWLQCWDACSYDPPNLVRRNNGRTPIKLSEILGLHY